MSHDVNMLRAKLRKALESIGMRKEHACPPTKSNIDPLMHELWIASEGEAYFKKRYADAKEAAIEMSGADQEIEDAVTRVKENDQGEHIIAATGDVYIMTVDLSKPSNRFDQKAMRNYMRIELGLSKQKIDAAFNAATSKASPAKRIKVASR